MWGHLPAWAKNVPPIMPPRCARIQSTSLDASGHASLTFIGKTQKFRTFTDVNERTLGAGRGNRTLTLLPELDFESSASTNSAIPASGVRGAAIGRKVARASW